MKTAQLFSHWARLISIWCGSWQAFLIAALFSLGWIIGGLFHGYDTDYQFLVNTPTTIITFLMVFLIQHSQNVDIKALQSKLDELIRTSEARNDLIRIEEKTEEEIERVRRIVK